METQLSIIAGIVIIAGMFTSYKIITNNNDTKKELSKNELEKEKYINNNELIKHIVINNNESMIKALTSKKNDIEKCAIQR